MNSFDQIPSHGAVLRLAFLLLLSACALGARGGVSVMIDTDSHVIVNASAGTHGLLGGGVNGTKVSDRTSWFAWFIPYDLTVGYDVTARAWSFGMYAGLVGFSRRDRSSGFEDSGSIGFQGRWIRGRPSTFGPGFELARTWEQKRSTVAGTGEGDMKESAHSLGPAITGDVNLFVPTRDRDGRLTLGVGARYVYWRFSDGDLFGCRGP